MEKSLIALAGLDKLLVDCAGVEGDHGAQRYDGKIVGSALFRERSDSAVVRLEAKGLTPGLHAVHVHAVGKCDGPVFTTAGGHFNPAGREHGLKSPDGDRAACGVIAAAH